MGNDRAPAADTPTAQTAENESTLSIRSTILCTKLTVTPTCCKSIGGNTSKGVARSPSLVAHAITANHLNRVYYRVHHAMKQHSPYHMTTYKSKMEHLKSIQHAKSGRPHRSLLPWITTADVTASHHPTAQRHSLSNMTLGPSNIMHR